MNFPPSNFPGTQPTGGEGTFSHLEHQDERREIKRPGRPVHVTDMVSDGLVLVEIQY